MGVIWTFDERTSQPDAATPVAAENPLSKGLVFAFDGHNWRDAVTGAMASPSGPPTIINTPRGKATYFSGSAYLSFESKDPWNVTGPITILWLGSFDATTGADRTIVSKTASNGTANTPFEFHINSGSGKPRIFRSNGSAYSAQDLSTGDIGAGFHSIFFADDANPIDAGVGYVNTTKFATFLAGSATTVTGTTQPLRIGRRVDGGAQLTGSVLACFIWSRRLNEAEYLSLRGNPWQLFEPENDPVFYSLGGGGVTIDATTGAAVAAGLGASVASPITVAANVGAATAAGLGAGVSSTQTVAGSVGAAVGAGLDANVASAITVAAALGAAVGAGLSATVSAGATVSASVGAATAAGLPAGVASPITVAGSAGAAVASGLSASISTGNSVAAGTGAAVGAGSPAGVSSPITVAANAGAGTAAGLQATVSTGSTVQAGTGAAIALGLASNISSTYIIAAGVGQAVAVGIQASITVGDEIEAALGAAIAAGLSATVSNPTVAVTAATGIRGGFAIQRQLSSRRAQIQTGRRRN